VALTQLSALMRPGSVEEVRVCVEHAVELFLLQDEQMIEALTPHASQKPFTDGIRSWGVIWYCENLDVTCVCEPCEAYPKLAIMITNKVLRPHTKGGGFSKLLCGVVSEMRHVSGRDGLFSSKIQVGLGR
jgi:hypothetical protein